MTLRSCPSWGSATSTRVVLEPMSMAAQSIRSALQRSCQTARMRVRARPGLSLRGRLRLDQGLPGMGCILELAEQPGDDEGDLLAHVDGVVADSLERPGDEEHRHRPLPAILVVADLDRELEALLVEVVDDVVPADEVARQLHVPIGEGALRLPDLGSDGAAHRHEVLHHSLVGRWLVPGDGDQLRDVHALIAHALDVLHHVKQRGDQPQVGGDGRLRREQRQDGLVDLQVAAVDDVVVGDHELGELDVLMMDRLDRAVQGRDHQIEALERPSLEAREPLAILVSGLELHQPNFPVTYCSVRSSSGVVNIFWVGPTSTSSPLSMNAVVSATRPACCMLWVTMAIVTLAVS